MLWKCFTQYASKSGKLSSGCRTGKGQFSFQSQRKAMPKNAQTTAQLHSSHSSRIAEGWLGEFWALLYEHVRWVQLCGSLSILWHCLSLGLEWKLTFSRWIFQICWHVECSTFTASSFRVWNSWTGIPSPPLALFVVMLSKAPLTSHSRMSGSRWVITPSWLSGSWRYFWIVLLCILATSS